jgi:hypothetical protein
MADENSPHVINIGSNPILAVLETAYIFKNKICYPTPFKRNNKQSCPYPAFPEVMYLEQQACVSIDVSLHSKC